MHGWPGAFTEFLDVIPRLTDAFDVDRAVAPGLRLLGTDARTRLGRARASRARSSS